MVVTNSANIAKSFQSPLYLITRYLIPLYLFCGCLGYLGILSNQTQAAVLPDERIDVLYHSYNGGGMDIDGPSVLVRKNFKNQFSIAGHYYIDTVSAASIDVETFASPYSEERTEKSVSANYLQEKTQYTLGYATSDENDYHAKSAYLNVAQDFFGDLTNVTLGYSRGWDIVNNVTDADFEENIDRENFRVGLSQILTPKLILNSSYENISDEGFLNNPYRSVRYLDSTVASGWSAQKEQYPNTRTSNAFGIGGLYYLDYGASFGAHYRFFEDTWDIEAHTLELKYRQRINKFTVSGKVRYYTQTEASFYSDLFPFENAQNFMARDKELSELDTVLVGIGLQYDFRPTSNDWIKKGSTSLVWDHYMIDYHSFRDATAEGFVAGNEPLYSLSANVFRFYFTLWY